MTARCFLAVFRSTAALAVVAAAALLPATAQATVEAAAGKVANSKDFAIGNSCGTNVALTSTVSASAAVRPVVPETPTALDRVRMSQEQPVAVVEIAPAGGNPVAARAIPAGADRLFVPVRAIVARPRLDCALQIAAVAPPASDDDSELGTSAIPVDTTRFDDRWARVRAAPAARVMQAQLRRASVPQGLGEATTLERVNLWVNRQIAYVDDDRNYRQRDFWATAEETVARGSGDCEDYAILKMHMLRAAGIAADRMKLVLLRDLAINADHAFLLVRSQAGWVVLDNMTDQVYDGRQAHAVRPILSFSGDRRWVHGYRDAAAPPVTIASAAPKASATVFASAAPAASGRRSSKTDWVNARGVLLALTHMSIGKQLPGMFGRLSPRGSR